MNTFQLQCFLAVANTLSFAKAAEQMNVSQPAITHQIKSLETELNVKLFRRSTCVVELTLEGQTFLPDARSIVAISEQALLRFTNADDRPILTLAIGCNSYRLLSLLEGSLSELNQQHQNFHPHLYVEQNCRRRAKLSQNRRHKMSVAAGCQCPKTDGVKWQGKRAIQPCIALLRV